MRKQMNNRSGAVLLIVLLVIVVLTVTVTEFLFSSWVEYSQAAAFRDGIKAIAGVRSGLDAGRVVIVEDRDNDKSSGTIDSLDEDWARDISIPFNDYFVAVKIEDENSKINLNFLVINGQRNEPLIDLFKRLLIELNLDDSIAEAVVDWIDEDESGLAESGYYGNLIISYSAKNGKLDSPDEIKRIRFITADVYNRLKPYVTIASEGRININSASKVLIMALHERVSSSMADELIKQRGKSAFRATAQMSGIKGFSTLYSDISQLVSVRSDSFSVTATAKVGEVTKTGWAIYNKRTTNEAKTVFYRVM